MAPNNKKDLILPDWRNVTIRLPFDPRNNLDDPKGLILFNKLKKNKKWPDFPPVKLFGQDPVQVTDSYYHDGDSVTYATTELLYCMGQGIGVLVDYQRDAKGEKILGYTVTFADECIFYAPPSRSSTQDSDEQEDRGGPPPVDECDYEYNPDACNVVPCEDDPDGDYCLYKNSQGQCVYCDELGDDFYPLPPYLDEDSSLSEEDAERAWRQFLLEQDMAKLTAGPSVPTTMGFPDDFIEKKLGPLIHPTGSSATSVPKNIRDMIGAGLEFIHPFLTRQKGVEELVLAGGPGPRPLPDQIGEDRGSVTPPKGWNPMGPVTAVGTPRLAASQSYTGGTHSLVGIAARSPLLRDEDE